MMGSSMSGRYICLVLTCEVLAHHVLSVPSGSKSIMEGGKCSTLALHHITTINLDMYLEYQLRPSIPSRVQIKDKRFSGSLQEGARWDCTHEVQA
jgi:hypothetical protein